MSILPIDSISKAPNSVIDECNLILNGNTDKLIINAEQFPRLKCLVINGCVDELVLNLYGLEYLQVYSTKISSECTCIINKLVSLNSNLQFDESVLVFDYKQFVEFICIDSDKCLDCILKLLPNLILKKIQFKNYDLFVKYMYFKHNPPI